MYKYLGLLAFSLMAFTINAKPEIDPTKPLSFNATLVESTGENRLVLQTVISDSQKNKKAIISGKLVSVGDNVNGYTVAQINDKSVLLTSLEQELKLSLFSGSIIKK